ncbi:MAG: ATP-binding protein [Planctomycetota bacterium]|nr:ATP-binding protein [Planctomycetota bacterium]
MNDAPERILVVDDEPGMREGCRRVLAGEGYEVECAADGAEGLEVFKAKRNFSAVLADLKMPRMGGLELIEAIRRLDEDVVLIVITAYATIETAVEATKRGAYGYIPKPFTPDEILLPVRNGLERRALALEAKRLRAEKERSLAALAEERSKTGTIINCMTDGVIVVNAGRKLVLRNAAAVRILPALASLALPAPLSEARCPDIESVVEEIMAGTGPAMVSREMTIEDRTYMANASPVLEGGPKPLGVVAVLRDITAIKKLEVAKSMFVSMVAHEIKNPLAAIEGYLNAVLAGAVSGDGEKLRAILDRCRIRARALREMVLDLLNITAIQTGRFVLRRARLDARTAAAEAVESFREKAMARNIPLAMEPAPPGGECEVLADRDALLSIFGNLVDNAIKYTPEGGRVSVGVRRSGDFVLVSVSDTGIGIKPEDRARIFEEFYRVRNEYTSKVPGTGLGLALVRQLVEMHQGRVSVESAPGKGSVFTVWLPAAPPGDTAGKDTGLGEAS